MRRVLHLVDFQFLQRRLGLLGTSALFVRLTPQTFARHHKLGAMVARVTHGSHPASAFSARASPLRIASSSATRAWAAALAARQTLASAIGSSCASAAAALARAASRSPIRNV